MLAAKQASQQLSNFDGSFYYRTEGGKVEVWGRNAHGRLGVGALGSFCTLPLQMTPAPWGNSEPLLISAGPHATFLVTEGGALYGWGLNSQGELGDPTKEPRKTPVPIRGPWQEAGIRAIQEDGYRTYLLSHDGKLVTWGKSFSCSSLPWEDLKVREFVANSDNGLVVTEAGNVYDWDRRPSCPRLLSGPWGDSHAKQVLLDGDTRFLLTQDGKVYSWGDNSEGQLGNGGELRMREEPVRIFGPWELEDRQIGIKRLFAHSKSIFALAENGKLYTWGRNSYGQLGEGTRAERRSPVAVSAVWGQSEIRDVVPHSQATFLLTKEGDLYAWGNNDFGRLGLEKNDGTRPTLIRGPWGSFGKKGNIKALGVSGPTTFIITDENQLFGWGRSTHGELGNGKTQDQSAPVFIRNLP